MAAIDASRLERLLTNNDLTSLRLRDQTRSRIDRFADSREIDQAVRRADCAKIGDPGMYADANRNLLARHGLHQLLRDSHRSLYVLCARKARPPEGGNFITGQLFDQAI